MEPTSKPAAPFVVSGRRRNGTVTYLCPDADWALRKHRHFEQMGYEGIAVTGPDGTRMDEARLARLVARGQAVPEAAEV